MLNESIAGISVLSWSAFVGAIPPKINLTSPWKGGTIAPFFGKLRDGAV
jgi:hypothetical protein